MQHYLIRRFLVFIPSLLALVMISFLLLKYSPGKPIDRMENPDESGLKALNGIKTADESELPTFYLFIRPLAEKGFEKFIPSFSFQTENQFHHWFFGGEKNKGVINGDLGRSVVSGKRVWQILKDGIGWSVFLTLLSLLLSYFVSIPAGLKMASSPNGTFKRNATFIFNILFSLPVFWVALLLLFLFSNPYILSIVPSSGVSPIGGFAPEISFATKITQTLPYLILPIICYTYGSFAFITATLNSTLNDVLKQDYIRTARAKGLSEKETLKKHAFKNALLPLITLFSHAFPAVISGSVIIETIFTIPGMGFTIYRAVAAKDYPVVIGVFFLTGIITMLTFLVADILSAYADPRIRYEKEVAK